MKTITKLITFTCVVILSSSVFAAKGQGSEGGNPEYSVNYDIQIALLEYEKEMRASQEKQALMYKKFFTLGDVADRLNSFLTHFDLNDIIDPKVREQMLSIDLEKLKEDVLLKEYVFKGKGECIDQKGESHPMTTVLTAPGEELIGAPICIDTLGLVKTYMGSGFLGRLVGLLLHEHIRHFGIDDVGTTFRRGEKVKTHPVASVISYHYNNDFLQIVEPGLGLDRVSNKFYRINTDVSKTVGVKITYLDKACNAKLRTSNKYGDFSIKHEKVKIGELNYYELGATNSYSMTSLYFRAKKITCDLLMEVYDVYGNKIGSETTTYVRKKQAELKRQYRNWGAFSFSLNFTSESLAYWKGSDFYQSKIIK